jgi:leader peptidase (prepilin peptidase) / N-methyltransferase
METQALETVLPAFSFVLGAIIGSFLNVVVYRLPEGKSLIRPGSCCPKCDSPIRWYDNIPIVSWLVLGAKCRNCSSPISWQYPAVEALTGALFLLVSWRFGLTAATPIYMVFVASLVVVTFVDLTHWIIPNEVSLPGILVGIGLALASTIFPASGLYQVTVFNSVIGAVAGYALVFLLDRMTVLILKKPGMGLGDAKLLAMLGAFFGWQGGILIVLVASFLGSAVGIPLKIALRFRDGDSDSGGDNKEGEPTSPGLYMPFGPFLCVGGLVVMFFGEAILKAYLGYMGLGGM